MLIQSARSPGRGEMVGNALAVLRGLQLDTRQRVALFFGLDNPNGRAINEKKIVSLAMPELQRELPHKLVHKRIR